MRRSVCVRERESERYTYGCTLADMVHVLVSEAPLLFSGVRFRVEV